MKRFLSVFLVMVLSFSCLVGCSSDAKETEAETTVADDVVTNDDGVADVINGASDSDIDESVVVYDTSNGTWTYDVDGVSITLRTNLSDYIHHDQYGYFVDLIGLAGSLGYSYQGTHDEVWRQTGVHFDSNPDIMVYFADLANNNQDFVSVCFSSPYHSSSVSFMRGDVDDDAIATYYISEENEAQYRVNFEQIVVFAFLLENGAYEPDEDWLETTGIINTSAHANNYHVFK